MGITIGGWVVITFGVLVLVGGTTFGAIICHDDEIAAGVTCIILSLIIGAICVMSPLFMAHTESGKRAYKDQQSNFNNGIERIVEVYDVSGDLIKTYEGRFDVETSAEGKYIKFDDENGKRHMIYYTTGTVIIEEK